MTIRKTVLAAAVSAAVATPALAVELEQPEAYGYLSAGALKIESADAEAEAFELELGLRGKAVIDKGLNLNYAVEVDLAAAANDDTLRHVCSGAAWNEWAVGRHL